MKKSKIKLLTATACLALIGTASAAWVYAGTATASANIGVKVASYADAGTITVSGADNMYVYIDNNSITFEKEDTDTSFAATYNKPIQFASASNNVTLTYQVVISTRLASFVKFATGVETIDTTDGTVATDYIYEWKSDEEITNLPGLTFASAATQAAIEGSETSYKYFVSELTGNSMSDVSSWYDQNKEYTATDKFNITINFKAVVSA